MSRGSMVVLAKTFWIAMSQRSGPKLKLADAEPAKEKMRQTRTANNAWGAPGFPGHEGGEVE